MSLKLLSCLFVLALAAIACEGNGRYFLRNPNYRDLYYRNQFYGVLSDPNPVPVRAPTADRVTQKVEEVNDDNVDEIDDTEDGIPGDEKGLPGLYDPHVLRPLITSLRTNVRQLVRTENESKEILKNILAQHEESLAWQKTQIKTCKEASFGMPKFTYP